MTVRDAAIQVLRATSKPLRADEITEKMISGGLWETTGKTPAATVAAALYSDIKKNGEDSPFRLVAPQTFSLKADYVPGEQRKGVPGSTTPTRRIRSADKTYSFTDSAEKVLEEFGKKQPLHYRQITEKALEMGWLVTDGKTPEATMYAQIITEIKQYQRRGEPPRFVQHGKGFVGLSRWMGKGLAFQVEQHNKKVLREIHKQLLTMEWRAFEELIAKLLAEIGFEDIELTDRGKDGGIDVRGTLVVGEVIRTRMAIQVKRWKNNVQAPLVQNVRGSLGTHEHGLIIPTSDFGKGARDEAVRRDATPIALMNGEELVSLLVAYSLIANRSQLEIFEVGEDDGALGLTTAD
jgi:restriction system protein